MLGRGGGRLVGDLDPVEDVARRPEVVGADQLDLAVPSVRRVRPAVALIVERAPDHDRDEHDDHGPQHRQHPLCHG